MGSEVSDTITVECACGKKLKAPSKAVGRKAKCPKCQAVLTIEAPPPPEGSDDLDALYDLAEKEATRTAGVVESSVYCPECKRQMAAGSVLCTNCDYNIQTGKKLGAATAASKATKGAKSGRGAGAAAAVASPLGYYGAGSKRERERSSVDVTIDMTRDVHVPLGLLVTGFALYLSYYVATYSLGGAGIAAVSLGLGLMTIFKAALLFGFALVIAGPVGVSFGGIYTAALKLAAIAIFCDGTTAWIDAGVAKASGMGSGGGFGMSMISFPIALGIYWVLLIYLFGMDAGDSWLVVMVLSVFDQIVRLALVAILLNAVLGWGGAAVAGAGGGFGGGGSGTSGAAAAAEETAEIRAMEDAKELREARALVAEGRRPEVKGHVEDWYKAGCKKVWFQVTWDINQKIDAFAMVVELPMDKSRRAECMNILKQYYTGAGIEYSEEDLADEGQKYLRFDLRE